MADVAAAVQKARQAGYSDAEIAAYIAKDPGMAPKVAQARRSGYSDADIVSHLGGAAPKRSLAQDVTGFMANVNRGLGIGDEVAGLAKGAPGAINALAHGDLSGAGDALKRGMSDQRNIEDSYAAAHPHLAALAKGTGNAALVAVPAGPAANALVTGSRVGNMARGAVNAAAQAATYAAVDRGSVKDRVKAASAAATDPLVIGMGAAGGALATAGRPKPSAANAPSLEDLQAQRSAAYKAVDDAKVTYTPEAVQNLATTIKTDLAKTRYDPDFHPAVAKMVQKLDQKAESGWSPTLSELDDMRKFVNENLTSSNVPREAAFGRQIRDQIDNFVDTAKPGDIVSGSGNAQQAADLISTARDLHARTRKVEDITSAVEQAKLRAASTGSGGNADNAIRQAIRRELEGGGYSADERQMLETIVKGGKGQNLLRQFGKLSPQGNGIMLAAHLGALLPSGGSSAAVAVGGALSKNVADAITQRNVDKLVDMIASGSKEADAALTEAAASDPAAAALRRQVAAKLGRAAGVLGGARASQNALAPAS